MPENKQNIGLLTDSQIQERSFNITQYHSCGEDLYWFGCCDRDYFSTVNFIYPPNILPNMSKFPDWCEDDDRILRENYLTKSKAELLNLFPKRQWSGISHRACRLGVIGRKNTCSDRGYNAKYKVDISFFKQWNPEVAYVFGRLITDGSWRLRKTGGEMRIKSIDKENLEKIKFVMRSNHKIKREKTPQGTYIYVFDIYNNELVRDLIKLETETVDTILNRNFFSDFLRGYIDGDGGIYIKNNSLEITITAEDKSILELLKQKLSGNGSIYSKQEKYYTLRFNRTTSENICNMIYEPRPFLYLSRKLSTWELWKKMKS